VTAVTAEHDLHVDRAMFIDFEGDLNREAGSLPRPRFSLWSVLQLP
jgi:hypothetical protein